MLQTGLVHGLGVAIGEIAIGEIAIGESWGLAANGRDRRILIVYDALVDWRADLAVCRVGSKPPGRLRSADHFMPLRSHIIRSKGAGWDDDAIRRRPQLASI